MIQCGATVASEARPKLPGMSLIDTGWAAWLPYELTAALEGLTGGSPARRAFRQLLAAERDDASRERWERFRLVAPSRVDVPIDGDGLTEEECYALLEGLGLVAGTPPRPVEPESVELVLTLDEEDRRELDGIRALRDPGAGVHADRGAAVAAGLLRRRRGPQRPCPCGSGQKFKKCHGR